VRNALALVALLLLPRFAAAEENYTVRVQEQTTIDVPGATAAYAIDPLLVDVATPGGGAIVLTGRSTGTTQLIAVTAAGSKAFLVKVGPPRAMANAPRTLANGGQPLARHEVRYASDARQLQNAFDVFTRDGDRRTHVHLVNVHYFRDRFDRAANAFPSAWYKTTTPGRELTILDDFVDVSPLTLHNTQVRGVHLQQRDLEIHAGYAAATMYEDVFLPSDRRWTAGAGYTIERGNTKWTPTLYGFFSEPRETSARRGVVASLIAEHRRGDTFFGRGEVGVARSAGASAELRYETPRDRGHFRMYFKPSDFPTVGLTDLPGLHAEGDWTHRATDRLTIDTFGGYDRFRLASEHDTTATANVDVRYALTPRVTLSSGGAATFVRAANADFRTISLPLGFGYDTPRFGAAVSYRLIDNSAASRRGDALRLSFRAGTPSLQANVWGERQRQAPTLSLIFGAAPGLELALLRLGISVRSPEDLARVLRDDAVLVNLGYISGVSVNLAPRRLQGGFDVAWNPEGNSRTQLRLHAIYSRDEGVATERDGLLATLSMSRRLTANADFFASYSWWRTRALPFDDDGSSIEVGLRSQFDHLPAFVQRRASIQGIVYLDPEIGGAPSAATTPLAGIAVSIDGSRTVQTNERGAYAFHDLQPGSHRVAAQLPAGKPAFFTTPSRVEADAPSTVNFGLVWSPARVSGRVVSDANLGIAGAVINVSGSNGLHLNATTDSEGSFVLPAPAGEYHLALATESLPPGYSIAGEGEQTVRLEADRPQQVAFAVQALRSISGTTNAPNAVVELQPLGKKTTADDHGRFAFRSLPAGTFTIVARAEHGSASRAVTLPAEPVTLAAIEVTIDMTNGRTADGARLPSPGSARAADSVATSGRPPATSAPNARATARTFIVQLGTFREPANVRQLLSRLRRLGQEGFTRAIDGLTVVGVGPFPSRSAASAAGERLRSAGFETLVVGR
jgi:cell division septation protein DedD